MTSACFFKCLIYASNRQMSKIFPFTDFCLVPGFISLSAREHVFCATLTFFAIFSGFNALFIFSRYVNNLFLICC